MRAVTLLTSAVRHSASAIAEAMLVATIVALLVAAFAPVYRPADWLTGGDVAAGRGGRAATLGAASCAVTPDPVFLGGDYTATARGLTPGAYLNVTVSGDGGSNMFMRVANGDGVASVSWHANWTGENSVRFSADDNKGTVLARCAFDVR